MRSGWTYRKLSDICSQITDGSHFSPKEDKNGKYPMLSVKDMDACGFNYNSCKFINEDDYKSLVANGCKPSRNDVLVAKDGSYLKTAFVQVEDIEQAILSSIAILKPKTNIISPYFLTYFFKAPHTKEVVEKHYLTGTAIKRVVLKGFRALMIPVPSLEEQERIVAELDLLTGIIDKQKAQLGELDTLAQSIFYDMFGDPVENEKGWEIKQLGDVCAFRAGKSIKSSELNDELSDGLFPCYGGNGIRGYIAKKSHHGCLPIIGRQGALCGNVNLASGDFYATEHAVVCTPSSRLNPIFLYYALTEMNLNQYAKGVAQPGLAVSSIIPLYIPIPVKELQESFAHSISNIEQQKESIKRSIAESQKLFDYTMDKYFG